MDELTATQRRKALREGTLFVPKDISWRRADKLVKAGLATLYPFHERWLGRLDFSEPARTSIKGERK